MVGEGENGHGMRITKFERAQYGFRNRVTLKPVGTGSEELFVVGGPTGSDQDNAPDKKDNNEPLFESNELYTLHPIVKECEPRHDKGELETL